MAHKSDDPDYSKAQSRQVQKAAEKYNQVDSGRESDSMRRTYDQELRRQMPVNGKGRKR
ncbi:hypothetical protein [Nonomuraea sp. WAC 01424]|uniref:hypothetical protein n=1 Tax=Nonomuraea sp. WAC 01424 TaxID=2203200 RepID=UPI00163C4D40|nr:hypothetical protein [Nonomuraea sp. WAC 01424]